MITIYVVGVGVNVYFYKEYWAKSLRATVVYVFLYFFGAVGMLYSVAGSVYYVFHVIKESYKLTNQNVYYTFILAPDAAVAIFGVLGVFLKI